jgi:uncharacterized protein with PIN domain
MALSHNHSRPSRFAEFRFYGELNDFLSAEQKQVGFHSPFYGNPSVKDTIQAIGVPHTAIDLILVDGRPVDFSHSLRGGERVAVYPVFERLDISSLAHLRPQPLRCTRFILDVHLGKLARYLRMLGFDTAYQSHWDDVTIIDLSLQQQRIILTRDIGILKQNRVTHGYWLRHGDPWEQLLEVMLALDLFGQAQPFTRCMECNGLIDSVDKTVITGQIDADILQRFEAFWQCRGCAKIYWRGSHYEHMLRQVEKFNEESRRQPTQ